MNLRNLAVFAALVLGMASSVEAQDMGAAPGDAAATPAPAAAESAPATAPAASDSSSAGPAKKISAGLLLGYGISFESGKNPWGVGLGLRGGYNIDRIFLGARFAYYLGQDPVNLWELGVDGGYDFTVADKVTLRPTLGLGIASITVSVPSITIAGTTVGGGSSSSSKFYIAPGASCLYDISDSIFLGGEARLMLITSSPMVKGLTILVNGGMRF
jgi:hypothetical protein